MKTTMRRMTIMIENDADNDDDDDDGDDDDEDDDDDDDDYSYDDPNTSRHKTGSWHGPHPP